MTEEKDEKAGSEKTRRYKVVHEAGGATWTMDEDEPVIPAKYKLPIRVVWIEQTTRITNIITIEKQQEE